MFRTAHLERDGLFYQFESIAGLPPFADLALVAIEPVGVSNRRGCAEKAVGEVLGEIDEQLRRS
jgi:hypothetical protein